MNIIDEISKIGIVPVIALDHAEDAEPLGRALREGGLNCAEVTFRTAAAAEAIRILSQTFPDMCVGAGTVLTPAQVDAAVAAGAKFIVSPGLNPTVVSYCVEKNIPIVPGCSSPSDIETALSFGLDVVKFFPAEAAGGLPMIKAMSAPYTKVRFMPTGGINAANLNDYLAFSKIIACGGSWMVSKDLLAARDFDTIREKTREAVRTMLDFKVVHVGINAEDEASALAIANLFGAAFGFGVKVGNSSIMAGKGVEVMKQPGRGEKGHIAISTKSVDRAVYHLEKQGIEFDYSTAKTDEKTGRMKVIYLKESFGGFAVHLLQEA